MPSRLMAWIAILDGLRHILYARYGTEAGGEVGRFIPGSGTVFEVAGAIGGHSVAGLQSDKVRR